mmetsp:Transcript_103661/g.281537  ORF Transcript_103661/g.281537 Transcript_103661/m.281537 type:complete len:233 (+) Transcript_103661:192-890(+)
MLTTYFYFWAQGPHPVVVRPAEVRPGPPAAAPSAGRGGRRARARRDGQHRAGHRGHRAGSVPEAPSAETSRRPGAPGRAWRPPRRRQAQRRAGQAGEGGRASGPRHRGGRPRSGRRHGRREDGGRPGVRGGADASGEPREFRGLQQARADQGLPARRRVRAPAAPDARQGAGHLGAQGGVEREGRRHLRPGEQGGADGPARGAPLPEERGHGGARAPLAADGSGDCCQPCHV